MLAFLMCYFHVSFQMFSNIMLDVLQVRRYQLENTGSQLILAEWLMLMMKII